MSCRAASSAAVLGFRPGCLLRRDAPIPNTTCPCCRGDITSCPSSSYRWSTTKCPSYPCRGAAAAPSQGVTSTASAVIRLPVDAGAKAGYSGGTAAAPTPWRHGSGVLRNETGCTGCGETRRCVNMSFLEAELRGTSAKPIMSPTLTRWDSWNGSAAADHTSQCCQQGERWSIPWIQGTWPSWMCPRVRRSSAVIHCRV